MVRMVRMVRTYDVCANIFEFRLELESSVFDVFEILYHIGYSVGQNT